MLQGLFTYVHKIRTENRPDPEQSYVVVEEVKDSQAIVKNRNQKNNYSYAMWTCHLFESMRLSKSTYHPFTKLERTSDMCIVHFCMLTKNVGITEAFDKSLLNSPSVISLAVSLPVSHEAGAGFVQELPALLALETGRMPLQVWSHP